MQIKDYFVKIVYHIMMIPPSQSLTDNLSSMFQTSKCVLPAQIIVLSVFQLMALIKLLVLSEVVSTDILIWKIIQLKSDHAIVAVK